MTGQDAATRATRTREQWIEWIDSACPHYTHDDAGNPIALFRSGCADCWMEIVDAAVAEAFKERDFQWWQAIACVDNWISAARREERHRSAYTGAPHVHCAACVAALDSPPASAPEGTK